MHLSLYSSIRVSTILFFLNTHDNRILASIEWNLKNFYMKYLIKFIYYIDLIY